LGCTIATGCPLPALLPVHLHFSLEKRRLQGDLIVAFQYLEGSYRKEGESLFCRICGDSRRANGFKR